MFTLYSFQNDNLNETDAKLLYWKYLHVIIILQ